MANLRADNLTGTGGRNAIDGSVFFDGYRSYLNMVSGEIISGTGFGTNDFTIEFWINQGVNDSNYTILLSLMSSTTADRFEVAFHSSTIQVYTDTGAWRDTGYAPISGQWEHIAFVRSYSGNTLKMYANGVEKWSVSNNHDYNEEYLVEIGSYNDSSYGYFQGYLSNFRVVNGTALYTTNYFTPPTEELKPIDGTVLLCCQDSENPTQEATGKEIVGFGACYYGKRYSNIATNGDLETGDTTGWTNSSLSDTFAVSTFSRSGSYSLHCKTNTNGSGVYTTVSLDTTLRYKISAYIYTVSTGSAVPKMKIGTSNGSNADYESQKGIVGKWEYVEWIGLPSASTTYISFVESAPGTPVVEWYVDDLRVELWYPEEGENILANPNFLDDATGWIFSSTPSGEYSISSNRLNLADNSRTSDAYATQQLFATAYKEGRYKVTIDYVLTSDDFDIGIGNNRIFGVAGGGTFSGEGNSASVTYEIEAGSTNSSLRIVGNQHCVGYFNSVTCSRVPEPKRNNPIPSVGVDEGVTFGGDTKVNSPNYMYFPTGDTTQRSRGRGLFAGGDANPSPVRDDISYLQIQSQGNAADFGNLSARRLAMGGAASSTRGVFCAGYWPNNNNIIDYVTIATTSNATDFGDSTAARHELAASSNNTRAIFAGGDAHINTIDYITIATTGDATDFGDNNFGKRNMTGAQSPTRGFMIGGRNESPAPSTAKEEIEYVTFSTTGTATDFGNLSQARGRSASVSSSTRAVIIGGETPTAVNTMDYITMATAGDATDFGDSLTVVSNSNNGCSNSTRGAYHVALISPAKVNNLQYITIASTGNSLDFGDLNYTTTRTTACSDSHGGI